MKSFLLGLGLLITCCQANAQAVAAARDSSLLGAAVRAAEQRYRLGAPESRLLNGVAYANNAPAYMRGHPFFQSSDPQPGTLYYDGQHFAAVELLYEQVLDQVLLYGPEQAGHMQLIRQKVREFELAGHRFVWLPADSAGVLAEGFYDMVVNGPTQFLVRRTKKVEAATGGYDMKGGYEEKMRFFVQRQGRFYELSTLKQTLTALADKKPEMQAYARRNRLRFATDSRETSVAELVKQYNSLVKE